MDKIAIKGDFKNGPKIIEYFMSLGATNPHKRNGMSNWYYYIKPDSNIIDVEIIKELRGYKIYETWEEFENTVLNKNKMEERNIKISLEKAKEWYKQGGDLKEVALQAFSEDELKDNFPKSWNEFLCSKGNMYALINHLTKDERKAMDALTKLIQLRDEYWRLDNNWQPDWTRYDYKYIIYVENNKIISDTFCAHYSRILSFRTKEIRDKFYKNFKDLIEKAKMFL